MTKSVLLYNLVLRSISFCLFDLISHAMFCKKLLAFIRPLRNDTYGIYDPLRVRLLDRLRLGFSHLRKAKFRHNFADTFESIMFMLS